MMKIVLIAVVGTLGAAPPAAKGLTVLIKGKAVSIRSVQATSPLRAYFPGAIGVSMLAKKPDVASKLKRKDDWNRLIASSVPSEGRFDVYNLRIRIVLANGTQILVDDEGRFVVKGLDTKDFEVWKGETRELRASQYISILEEFGRLGY